MKCYTTLNKFFERVSTCDWQFVNGVSIVTYLHGNLWKILDASSTSRMLNRHLISYSKICHPRKNVVSICENVIPWKCNIASREVQVPQSTYSGLVFLFTAEDGLIQWEKSNTCNIISERPIYCSDMKSKRIRVGQARCDWNWYL